MTTKLIKIENNWIVTDNEELLEGMFWLHPKGIIFPYTETYLKVYNSFKNIHGGRLIYSQNPEHSLPTIILSDEVAKELGLVDTERLAIKDLENYFGSNLELNELGKKWIEGYSIGYNQCLQDNVDKKFTEKEAELIFGLGAANNANGKPSFEEIIQSLTKQEYHCELEMEYKDIMGIWHTKPTILSELDRPQRPKITNNSVKITKI